MIDWIIKRLLGKSKILKEFSATLEEIKNRLMNLESEHYQLADVTAEKDAELLSKIDLLMGLINSVPSVPSVPRQGSAFDMAVQRRAKEIKPSYVINEMMQLFGQGKGTADVERIVVEEKRLISHTQFYRNLRKIKALGTEVPREVPKAVPRERNGT